MFCICFINKDNFQSTQVSEVSSVYKAELIKFQPNQRNTRTQSGAHSCRYFEMLKVTHDPSLLTKEISLFPLFLWIQESKLKLIWHTYFHASELCGITKNNCNFSLSRTTFPFKFNFLFLLQRVIQACYRKIRRYIYQQKEHLKKSFKSFSLQTCIQAFLKDGLQLYIGFVTVFLQHCF